MIDQYLYLHIFHHIFTFILIKFCLLIGSFFLFLGLWLEVKKKPKTPTYLRIFRAKRKPDSLKPILLLLGEEDKIINVVISRPVQGQTAHFDFGTTAPDWSRKRGQSHENAAILAPLCQCLRPRHHSALPCFCAYKYRSWKVQAILFQDFLQFLMYSFLVLCVRSEVGMRERKCKLCLEVTIKYKHTTSSSSYFLVFFTCFHLLATSVECLLPLYLLFFFIYHV